MVKKGNTQEQSEAGIDMTISLVKFLKSVKLNIGIHEGLTTASLKMKLDFEPVPITRSIADGYSDKLLQ
jgi:hypothetical protein